MSIWRERAHQEELSSVQRELEQARADRHTAVNAGLDLIGQRDKLAAALRKARRYLVEGGPSTELARVNAIEDLDAALAARNYNKEKGVLIMGQEIAGRVLWTQDFASDPDEWPEWLHEMYDDGVLCIETLLPYTNWCIKRDDDAPQRIEFGDTLMCVGGLLSIVPPEPEGAAPENQGEPMEQPATTAQPDGGAPVTNDPAAGGTPEGIVTAPSEPMGETQPVSDNSGGEPA